jgi:prolyl-tRNA editing enzyme YbaK/EbsC (Cys-tRNA(Pro) deacylase)
LPVDFAATIVFSLWYDDYMKFGTLDFVNVTDAEDLVSKPSKALLTKLALSDILVSSIDPGLSDTAAFCDYYHIDPQAAANCIIIEARRAERVWYVACVVLASTKADVNGVVRKLVDASKVSFAPVDKATALTSMEFGAITPVGLPDDWTILIDEAVARTPQVIIGSGIRTSKLLVPGALLPHLPSALVSRITKSQVSPDVAS